MNTSTYTRTAAARSAHATNADARSSESGGGRSRFADYIGDVFFVALLAAPFLIFQSPGSVQDAVVGVHAPDASVAVTAATPAPASGSAYGPE